ncbi:NADH dehydrogenase [Asanoa ishikariensis]|nr:NADH dehydrogenase [Asanoa ishikariensis]
MSKKLRAREAEVTVVDPQPHMTYQPFLPEASAGNISPRHAVVPLRRELRNCHIVAGTVTDVSHDRKVATVQPIVGPPREIEYDHIIVAPGSVSRTLPIPGLREHGIGFKTIGEAIYLRNHVLDQLDVAASTTDPAVRERALTFVFVGGGYAGIEAVAEMEDMAHDAVKRYYPELSIDEMHWVLVEATNRVLPEVDRDMGAYTVQVLLKRKLDIRLGTRLESCVDGIVKLSDGDSLPADTIVWTAGVKPSPMLDFVDLPKDQRGRITTNASLQVVDGDEVVEGAWSAGDCAAVPDLTGAPGAFCSPSAQHAVRQANQLADNIRSVIRGRQPAQYKHKHVGSVASLGLHKGVAQVYGIKLTGIVAWLMHRAYHLSRIPSTNRKVRVLIDWMLALFLRRETVSLGQLHDPKEEFTDVTPHIPAPPEVPAPPTERQPATAGRR